MADKTLYDGVTYNYNKYLEMNGAAGFKVQNPISGLDTYTMSVWFRLTQLPWVVKKDMTIIQFTPNAFRCYVNTAKNLQCDSDGSSTSL